MKLEGRNREPGIRYTHTPLCHTRIRHGEPARMSAYARVLEADVGRGWFAEVALQKLPWALEHA